MLRDQLKVAFPDMAFLYQEGMFQFRSRITKHLRRSLGCKNADDIQTCSAWIVGGRRNAIGLLNSLRECDYNLDEQ